MGMDVYGNNPTTKAGAYFRNNVHYWGALVDYLLACGPVEIVGKCRYWNSNDGDGLPAKEAAELGAFLRNEIKNGNCKKYAGERRESGVGKASFDNHPLSKIFHSAGIKSVYIGDPNDDFSVDNVQAFAEFLEGCGGFQIF